MHMTYSDLTIIGAGMSGLTMAAAVKPALDAGLTITMIDPASAPEHSAPASPSFDDRATALSEQTLDSLQALGLNLDESGLTDIRAIEVSNRGHAGYHRMRAAEQGRKRYGAIIANRSFGALLWRHCRQSKIHCQFEQQVARIEPRQNGHLIHLSSGEQVTTKLLILCDGGRSELAQELGFQSVQRPFNAVARIATVTTEIGHQGQAFERFTDQGPIALLPFGQFSALVWTIPERNLSTHPMDKAAALSFLNAQFGQRLGRIKDISDWQQYPLIEKYTTAVTSHHCLMLGNAAATLHPVAGQGFNLAARGIMRSAELINKTYLEGKSLPQFDALNELSQANLRDQHTTLVASRALIELFGTRNPIIQLGRNLGLNSLDRHPLFSQIFALAGMGYLADGPIL